MTMSVRLNAKRSARKAMRVQFETTDTNEISGYVVRNRITASRSAAAHIKIGSHSRSHGACAER
jgi:hypothetical protein